MRILLGRAGQPLRMHYQTQFNLLVLAFLVFAEIDYLRMAAMRADHALLAVEHGKRIFARRDGQRNIGCHAGSLFFHMKFTAALATDMSPVLDADGFDRHHRAAHDRRAVAAAGHLTRAVLGPEGVDDLWAFVTVILAFVTRDAQRVETGGHHLLGRQVRPPSFFTLRAVAAVVGHDLRLDLGLDVGQQLFHLLQIDIGQLLLDHEPRHRIEVIADHLHPKARAFHQCGTAAHEDVGHLQVLERAPRLVVGIVVVPHQLGRVRRVIWRFGGRRDEHRTKHAGAPPRHHLDIW